MRGGLFGLARHVGARVDRLTFGVLLWELFKLRSEVSLDLPRGGGHVRAISPGRLLHTGERQNALGGPEK